MARFSIKRYLPRSLYGRAALILLVPIVTIQLVVSFSFTQRLYEDVTRQMTSNVSVELQLLLDTANAADSPAQARAALEPIARGLQMPLTFPGGEVRDRRRFYDLSGRAIVDTLALRFDSLLAVDLVSADSQPRPAHTADAPQAGPVHAARDA